MTLMANPLVALLVGAMAAVILMLSIENNSLHQRLDACFQSAATVRANNLSNLAAIEQQNIKVRGLEKQADEMRAAGKQAQSEAAATIAALRSNIETMKRQPRATTCEEARTRMIQYAKGGSS